MNDNVIVKSPYKEVPIPDCAITPLVLRHERKLANHIALVDGMTGLSITYRELAVLIRKVAYGFVQMGLQRGDVVAIYSPNLPDYVIAFHGVSYAGGTVTTVNPMYTAGELERQVQDASAKFLLTTPELLPTACKVIESQRIQTVLLFGDEHDAPGNTVSFNWLKKSPELENQIEIEPKKTLLALPYSSGTTGLAKGVMITHHNMVSNICQFEGVTYYSTTTKDDNLVAVLPFYHIYGMMVFMCSALYQGATVITMPRFDLVRFLEIMQNHKVTRAYVVPPIVLALAKHPAVDEYDLSSLKVIFSGAAPLALEIAMAVEQRIGCQPVQGYGLTETSPVTNIGPDAEGKSSPGSVGPPICNTEMKVIDIKTREDLEVGQTGEVCIRGPQVMKGYLHNPAATDECIDEDRWFHTGDVGYADEKGYFHIVDRAKELIKYKGYQVAPAELEALLLSHPDVLDAAVIGLADEEAGEIPKAFVVPKKVISDDSIKEFVAGKVAPYKKIRVVEFVENIPKAPSGKILRRLLRG